MDDAMELELAYKGKDLNLPIRLFPYGYTYRIEITIDDMPVIFEPDEEGSYRVLSEDGPLEIDTALLAAITEKLESLK